METASATRTESVARRPDTVETVWTRFTTGRRGILTVAVVLILVQTGVRGWVAGSGYFYWDDLILVSRAARFPLLSHDLLLGDHDGHLMPLAFAVSWVVTSIAPLVWALPVVLLVAAQAAASLAVLRMLVVLAGVRTAILVPLAFYLFCPLTVTAFAWWSAALNALPLQFALAWVIADAVALTRTGRTRYAISGVLVTVFALLFFEKAVVVPVVAFAVAVLVLVVEGRESPVRTVLRRASGLWAGCAVVLIGWVAIYLTAVGASAVDRDFGEVRTLLPGATSAGLVPALVGGPWVWERWLPSMPWADPPGWTVALSWAAVVLALLWSVRARERVWPVWLMVTVYVLVAELPVALARGGPNTAGELMQSLRYFADATVVFTAAGTLFLRARPRGEASDRLSWVTTALRPTGTRTRRLVLAATALFVVSGLFSTYTFVRSWRVTPTSAYLSSAREALAAWDGVPLLDQEVPWTVLNPLAYPENLASRVLAPIAAPGTFAESTPRLRMFTDDGRLVEAVVWWNRGIVAGPEPGCGHRLRGPQPMDVPLNGPMLEHEWTAQLNYLSDRDGRITVGFERGRPVAVPVTKGLHTVFVRVVGSGSALRIGSATPGLDLCLGEGPVGVASFDF
ncbi:hypothetical protein ACTD5D_24520 [Nocardia takedensis]|uniref:hypothetical protein n=1 Tax=Nocardia takedensis TaxID=259390 RepID=UPI00030A069A|nr:hypothetical protein [Nocardia takedensis]